MPGKLLTNQFYPANHDGDQESGRVYSLPSESSGILEEIQCARFSLYQSNSDKLLPGDAVVVNPEISSGLPIATINRHPQPASRPEKYNTPATKGKEP
jgi:hypothetical protein